MDRRTSNHPQDTYQQMLKAIELLKKKLSNAFIENALDVLIYPTSLALPALLGRPQKGTNGMLSAATGTVAMTIPAGISTDGSAVGLELLAPENCEQRLLNIAQAWHLVTKPAFLGTTFLPPLSKYSERNQYILPIGSATFYVECQFRKRRLNCISGFNQFAQQNRN